MIRLMVWRLSHFKFITCCVLKAVEAKRRFHHVIYLAASDKKGEDNSGFVDADGLRKRASAARYAKGRKDGNKEEYMRTTYLYESQVNGYSCFY